jgi:tetrahydromethanopterin S-methyltransferase subunit F
VVVEVLKAHLILVYQEELEQLLQLRLVVGEQQKLIQIVVEEIMDQIQLIQIVVEEIMDQIQLLQMDQQL